MFLLPSLNRPEQCQQVLDRLGDTRHKGILFVNGGDYSQIFLPDNWEMVVSPSNLGLAGACRWAFEKFPNEPFYGLITDDEFLASHASDNPHWEQTLVDAAGDWFLAHGNNGWQSGRRAHGYMTIGGDLVREVGWWMPPELWHWYSDDFWEAIVRNCGLQRFCLDVRLEDRHYISGKSPKDSTYETGESRKEQDATLFHTWLHGGEASAICNRVLNRVHKIQVQTMTSHTEFNARGDVL